MTKNTRAVWLALALCGAGPALAADGAALYEKTCASCHGKEGKNGTAIPVAGRSETVVTAAIKSHPPPMNTFKLSAKEIQAVAKYVAGLKP
ncbi:MAG TPA: cytochrome c [Myxococcaceae bacterium]|nr:cytochrome c [Myxococcaceae bacterium]